jgi:hypothetical protein
MRRCTARGAVASSIVAFCVVEQRPAARGGFACVLWQRGSSIIVQEETKRVKHIDMMHHFARDHVASGELVFLSSKLGDNVSDCLTRAMPWPLFKAGLVGLGMLRV